jgi:hypothetical protein
MASGVIFNPLSLRFILYMGDGAAGFEPELVKLAALPLFPPSRGRE